MHIIRPVLAVFVLLFSGPIFAQNWFMFEDKAERFTVNFPEEPTVTDITYESDHSMMLPAKVYRASDGTTDYSIIVVNYVGTSISEARGSIAFAAWNFRKRGGEITYDGYAQIDRIEGHQLQILNEDMSRTFIAIHLHDSRLFILEATTPAGVPPPLHFQNSIGIFDQEGNRVRYQIDVNGQTERWYRGGAYGESPDGYADLYDIEEELAYRRGLDEGVYDQNIAQELAYQRSLAEGENDQNADEVQP